MHIGTINIMLLIFLSYFSYYCYCNWLFVAWYIGIGTGSNKPTLTKCEAMLAYKISVECVSLSFQHTVTLVASAYQLYSIYVRQICSVNRALSMSDVFYYLMENLHLHSLLKWAAFYSLIMNFEISWLNVVSVVTWVISRAQVFQHIYTCPYNHTCFLHSPTKLLEGELQKADCTNKVIIATVMCMVNSSLGLQWGAALVSTLDATFVALMYTGALLLGTPYTVHHTVGR